MDPSRMPAELFDKIIDFTGKGNDPTTLCNLCRVSRRWRDMLHGRVYSKWFYDGEYHSIASLWKFLRSVLSSKHIANRIEEINIRSWTLGLNYKFGRLVLLDDDIDLIQKAICRSGLQQVETDMLVAVRKADPRPFVALLLANVPNLTKLYADIPESALFIDNVLRKAATNGQDMESPLRSLREVHISGAWNYPGAEDESHPDSLRSLSMDGSPLEFFSIPSIERLSVFKLVQGNTERMLKLKGIAPRSSTITDLTLVHNRFASPPQLSGTGISALLAVPKMLTNLSIRWHQRCEQTYSYSNADLWKAIRQHAHSLVALDVFRTCSCGWIWAGPDPAHGTDVSHFGPMQSFTRLQRLCIQPQVLLGGCCNSPYAPFQLKDTLPLSIKSLTFYDGHGQNDNPTLIQQFQDVMASNSFRLLDHIALERSRDLGEADVDPPHDEVERACNRHGRKYETKDHDACTHGGSEPRRQYYDYYESMGGEVSRWCDHMEIVRSALTRYLSKLCPKFWPYDINDLDTFELPWDELIREGEESDFSDHTTSSGESTDN